MITICDLPATPNAVAWCGRGFPALGYSEGMIVAGVEVDEARLAAVCERYGIGQLMIFGSVSRGTSGPASDVDILYELRPGRRLGWEIEDLVDELTEVFGRPVDLVSRAALHERMRAAVLAEAQLLYAA
jgi:predicted nucleotidyltransferase